MIKTWQERCDQHEGIVTNQMIKDRMQEEIDELRQALDHPTPEQIALAQQIRPRGKSRIRQALAQPEQKPVAWYGGYEGQPLYTAPPKKEWVGLTDEEKFKIANSTSWWKEAFAIIEAKLKEKNT